MIDRIENLLSRAAALGVEENLADRTPKEIERILIARAAREKREMERLDAAAWLIGGYVALAILTPAKYPKKPCGLRPREMQDDEMKAVLIQMAQRRTT